jgi:hypothetical protein
MMTREEAFDCGVRCQNMDSERATRTFYEACGIKSTTIHAPASPNLSDTMTYKYWCPDSDPASDLMEAFANGFYNG